MLQKPITNEEEESLWETGQLGGDEPEILKTLWFLMSQHYGLRAQQEHHSMRMEKFKKVKGENGNIYIEFHENPTKTRGSGLHPKTRVSVPKMFAIGRFRSCNLITLRNALVKFILNCPPSYTIISTNLYIHKKTGIYV